MNHVVYDTALCKVEIVQCMTGYGWFVIVDEDPEHFHCRSAVSYDEALREAQDVYETMQDECGQFGVGA
jgi:hypothetical protein